jgi:hypothetical protein
MKNTLYGILVVLAFMVACSDAKKDNEGEGADSLNIGNQQDSMLVMDINELINNAEEMNGKEIAVSGTVVHVCKHSGKRLHLLGADDSTKIRVEAGEIGKFDKELEGSSIRAKGIFRVEVIDEESLAKWSGELHEHKEGHDKSDAEMKEEEDKIERYREMMGETEDGKIVNYWIDASAYETSK